MTCEEILALRLAGQHLLSPTEPITAVRDLCGVQAQYLSHGLHALSLRTRSTDTRGMVKTWANRGTMHLIAEEDLPLFLHRDRTHFLRPVDTLESDGNVNAQRKQYFAGLILDAAENGTVTRDQLKALCAEKGMTDQEASSLFDPWGGIIRALCEEGKLCHEVCETKAYRCCPAFDPLDAESARLELARRYFSHFGPATVRDAAYFFGSTQTAIRKYLKMLPVTETNCDGKAFYHIPRELSSRHERPVCLFLAGFDQFLLGYDKKESLILAPEHMRGIFTLSGMVRPAVLLKGKVVGFWNLKNRILTVTCFCPCDHAAIRSAGESQWPDLRQITIV